MRHPGAHATRLLRLIAQVDRATRIEDLSSISFRLAPMAQRHASAPENLEEGWPF